MKGLLSLKNIKSDPVMILVCVVIGVLAFIYTLPSPFFLASKHIPIGDEAIYQYIGWAMTKGQMPYVDVFDHKGPLVYILFAIGCRLSTWHGQWLVDYVFMCMGMAFSYRLSRLFLGRGWSLVICGVIFSCFLESDMRAFTPEFYSLVFVAMALEILSRYILTDYITKKDLVWFGVVSACSFWLKHITLVTTGIVVICIVLYLFFSKKFYDIWRCIKYTFFGFLGVSVPICLWLTAKGAIGGMIKDYFVYNFMYAGNEGIDRLARGKTIVHLMVDPPIALTFIMIALYIGLLVRSGFVDMNDRRNVLFLYMIPALLISIIFVAMPGRAWYHYVTSFYPILIVIISMAIQRAEICGIEFLFPIEVLCLVAVMYYIVIPNYANLESKCNEYWDESKEITALSNEIYAYSKPEDTIVIQAYGPNSLYIATGRRPGSIYIWGPDVFKKDKAFLHEYRKQIIASNPAILIWTYYDSPYEMIGKDVMANYSMVGMEGNNIVYARKDRVEEKEKREETELTSTVDIDRYLDKIVADDETALFTIKDIHGYALRKETINRLIDMGFSEADKFLEKKYHSFIGVYYKGQVLYANVGDDEDLSYRCDLNGHWIQMASETYHNGDRAMINIDSVDYAINERGFNIVVFDEEKGTVEDSVSFDTHAENTFCWRKKPWF